MSRRTATGAVNLADAAEQTYHGVPVSDLCREERWKAEESPLDIWDKLLAHAQSNETPAVEDVFRFKFHGLFHVAPAQDSFMLRLRIPGGKLTGHQLRSLADMAERYGSGRADITTRANKCEPRNTIDRTGHIGIHPQRQPDLHYIGVSVFLDFSRRHTIDELKSLLALKETAAR
jgi:hypothetical protein